MILSIFNLSRKTKSRHPQRGDIRLSKYVLNEETENKATIVAGFLDYGG
jgi:hypothetical protein